jgi:hypothetical protein
MVAAIESLLIAEKDKAPQIIAARKIHCSIVRRDQFSGFWHHVIQDEGLIFRKQPEPLQCWLSSEAQSFMR